MNVTEAPVIRRRGESQRDRYGGFAVFGLRPTHHGCFSTMKTRGLANLHTLTDDELRRVIGSAALDVYEAGVIFGDYELDFALGTLELLRNERQRRERKTARNNGEPRPATKLGFLS